MMSGTETNYEEGEEDTLGFNFIHQEEINSLPSTSVLIDTGSTVSVFKNKELLRNVTKSVHIQMEVFRFQSYKVIYQVF